MPFTGSKTWLSDHYAIKCFYQNYRSLNNKGGWEKFNAAVSEYAELQHAVRVPQSDLNKPKVECFYLPMHGVKEASTTKECLMPL